MSSESSLQVDLRQNADENRLVFRGSLTEFSDLIVDPAGLRGKVVLDLEGLQRVNSSGCQIWVTWIRKFPSESLLHFERISPAFAQLACFVDGVIPPTAEISSFFVPYADELGESPENVLFVRNTHFTPSELNFPPFIRSEISQQRLEIDVVPQKYFRFLQKRYPDLKLKS